MKKALLLAAVVLGVTIACPLLVLVLHTAAGYGAHNALEMDASAALGTGGGMGLGVQLLLAAVAGLALALAAVLGAGYYLYARGELPAKGKKTSKRPHGNADAGRWASGPNAYWQRSVDEGVRSSLDLLEQVTSGGAENSQGDFDIAWWRL